MSNEEPTSDTVAASAAARHANANGSSTGGGGRSPLGSAWRFIRVFPWTLLLIAVAWGIEATIGKSGGDLRGTPIDYIMIVFSMVVLIFEIAKSTDIRMVRFVADLAISVLALIAATVLLTIDIMTTGQVPGFYLWIVVGVLLVDAVLSPAISFATALRNMSLG
jgi:hypothetical protein